MILNGRYFIDNPEAGYYEVSIEYYEAYHKRRKEFMDMFLPKTNNTTGKIIITSTVADDNGSSEFYKNLWTNDTNK